ncbi:MAG: AsmA family protein [Desulfovibrio sp.]|jgi:uncharacterized protein involved in outer membrane biogenesis|nr:AsmA family protein [Desulfovibrio sp.]
MKARRVLLWTVVLIVLLACGFAILVSRIDTGTIVKKIADASAEATGSPLVFETAPSISIFPLGATFGPLKWGEIKDGEGLAVAAKGGAVRLALMPLFSGEIVIDEVIVDQPLIQLVQKASPKVAQDAPSKDAPAPQKDSAPPKQLPVELGRLAVAGAQVRITQPDGSQIRIENIDLRILDLRRNERATIECKLAYDLAPSPASSLPKRHGALNLKGKFGYDNGMVTIQGFDGKLDDTTLQADLVVSMLPVLSVTGEVKLGVFNLDGYLPAGQSAKKESPAPAKTAAKEPAPKDPATAKAAQSWPAVDLKASMAQFSKGKLQVKDISFRCAGKQGVYELTGLKASLAGGTVKVDAKADLPAKGYAASLAVQNISVGALLVALGKEKMAEGNVAFNADVHFQGDDPKIVMQSLSGKGLLEARKVTVPKLAQLAKSNPMFKSLVPDLVDLVRAPFTITNGEVVAKPVTVNSAQVNVDGRATANLPKQFLDAAAEVKTLGTTVPVTAKGPFSNISVGIDPKFALEGAKNLPGAIMDGGKGAEGAAKKGAKGLVKGILGR